MNWKFLFIALLCVLSASIVFVTGTATLNSMEKRSIEAFTYAVNTGHLVTNRTEPRMGDPTDGWP